MSVHVMSEVFAHSKATLGSRLVLLAIADCADKETRTAWPSVAYLAKAAKLSESAVHRAIRHLAALGELEIVPQTGRSNLYRVREFAGATSGTGANMTPPVKMAPTPPQNGTPPVPPAAPKPSENRQEPSGRERAKKKTAWHTVPETELLTPKRREMAREVGLHPARTTQEWQKFSMYYFAQPKRDVDATWRNWVVRALDDAWTPPPDPKPRVRTEPEPPYYRRFQRDPAPAPAGGPTRLGDVLTKVAPKPPEDDTLGL